jgi:uncharacterized YigZ family protein
MQTDTYLTIAQYAEGTFKDRGSKFIGFAFEVTNEDEVKEKILYVKKLHPTARHVCYAYRIDPLNEKWRANDDGEPASSAGKPILNQMKSVGVQNCLVAVVRYFGGTLLGVPGLIHAYKEAANLALQAAGLNSKLITVEIEVVCPYAESGDLMKIIKQLHVDYKNGSTAEGFLLLAKIPFSEVEKFLSIVEEKGWTVSRK